jgi:subtilisin family serine protease
LIAVALVIVLIAITTLIVRKDDVRTVAAKLFETKIVVRGEGSAKWHYFDYNLPKARPATLWLSNSARTNAPSVDRVKSAEVTLRGEEVVTPKEFNQGIDVLPVPVKLKAGLNRLGVRLQADSGKRVSLRIDALADKIVLAPLLNPVVLGHDSLRARATVTGLGSPVPGAMVQFEALGLGARDERRAVTNDAGSATALMTGLTPGDGVLRAMLAGTALVDEISTLVVRPLKLNPPRASPPGIPPSSAKTPVVFRTLVTGTRTPPSILCLDEVMNDGVAITRGITALLDDGEDADTLAGDGFYAATLPIGHPQETDKFYRLGYAAPVEIGSRLEAEKLCAEYSGKMVTSGIITFPITELRLEARPFKPRKLVQDPNSTARYVVDELALVANRGTSPSEIRALVKAVGNTPAAPAARIVLFMPALDNYSVKFDGDDTAEAVQRAIKAFSAHKEVVASASPNFEVLSALLGDPNDESYTAGDQWYLGESGIRANAAWAMGARGSATVNVAVIDYGIDYGHPDLAGKSISASGVCDPTTVSEHGTWAAGPIAANTDNVIGIAGVAWNAKLLSCYMTTPVAEDLVLAISTALESEVRILNFSLTTNPIGAPNLQSAVCDAICAERLVVAAAGNQGGSTCPFVEEKAPAYYNRNETCSCSTFGITAFSEGIAGDGIVTVRSDGHGLRNDDQVEVTGTTNYDGTYTITGVTPDTFDITAVWRGTETGNWAQQYIMQDAILAVGALDDMARAAWEMETGDAANCSNHGPWIDLWAPGKTILTTDPPNTHDTKGGTSLAAPIASGAAAVVWAIHPTWKHTDVESRLRTTASAVNKNTSDYANHPYFGDITDPVARQTALNNRLTGGRLDLFAAVADPYDIVFVLDRSGSMNSTTHIDPAIGRRWDALSVAVSEFTNIIEHTAPTGSNFGLTLFASDFVPNLSFPSGLVSTDGPLHTDVNTELANPSQSPFGATAMGKGLKNGIIKMSNDTLRPRVLVLFTDGEQNVPPFVNDDGCGFSDGSLPIRPSCPTTLPTAGTIKIITVGIGSPSSGYHTTLMNLAHNNRGHFIITSDGGEFSQDVSVSTVDDAFSHAVVPALAGNSPQVVTSYKGTLSNTVILPAFDLNKNVSQLLIKLSFSRKFEIPELLSILAGLRIMKDASDITRYFQLIIPTDHTNSVLLKASFVYQPNDDASTISSEGSYTVQLTAPPNRVAELGYEVVPYADDHLLDMEWQVSPVTPRVNQAFKPTISLSWRGSPVTNASVEAWILKPGGDMGDLLAKHPQTIDPSGAPDAGSPGYQKYIYLLKNDPDFIARLQPNEQKLTLVHQGDGQYSADYNPGDVSGIYQILYRVSAEHADFGKIQRQAVQSVYTRFGEIDIDESAVSSTVGANTVTINFRPITNYGRFIGPAQGSAFSVDGAGIRLSRITDHQDGRYTVVLAGDSDAQVSIKLLGEEIYQGPASEMGKGLGPPWWLIWLIIIVILPLLIWLVWYLIGRVSGP